MNAKLVWNFSYLSFKTIRFFIFTLAEFGFDMYNAICFKLMYIDTV
jgi:hypothetical protein